MDLESNGQHEKRFKDLHDHTFGFGQELHTGCIRAFSGVENDVENGNETTNPIGIFTALNIDIDI